MSTPISHFSNQIIQQFNKVYVWSRDSVKRKAEALATLHAQ